MTDASSKHRLTQKMFESCTVCVLSGRSFLLYYVTGSKVNELEKRNNMHLKIKISVNQPQKSILKAAFGNNLPPYSFDQT